MPSARSVRHRAMLDAWVAEYGQVCPGAEGHPPHRVNPRRNPLTIDHIRPRAAGGSDAPENLRVLCREQNSRRHDGNPASRAGLRRGNPKPPAVGPPIERGPEYPHPLLRD